MLSVIIITKNEEHNIRACLESVTWADEIVVVADSDTTDNTVAIAKEFTQKVFVRAWEGFGAAKNYALAKTTNEWIFWIDADERVTPELRTEIQVVAADQKTVAAYSIPRKANFLGNWIHHCGWYPGRVIRLFRRATGTFSDDKVHEHLDVNGTVGTLQSDLLHYTDPDLYHYFEKYNRYTSLAAEELTARGKQFHFSKLIFNPVWIFLKMYIVRLGFLDGIPGLILCVCSANYVFTKYAKLWEASKQGGKDGTR